MVLIINGREMKMESKPAIQSTTYWGLGLMVFGYIAPAISALLTESAPQIHEALLVVIPDLLEPYIAPYIQPAIFALGLAIAKYGRDTAEKPISGVFKKKQG